MKRLLLPLVAALALPVSVNAKESFNYESICTLTSEYNSNYTIEIYHQSPKKLGILYYKDEPKFSLTFDSTHAMPYPDYAIERYSRIINPHYYNYYTGQKDYFGDSMTGNLYYFGSRISFRGNIPLKEYLARTRKEQLKVRGKGRMLLLDLGRVFNFLPDTEKEISREEWYRVAINFWKKDKKICTYSLYEFW